MRAVLGGLLALVILGCGGSGSSAPPPVPFTISLTPATVRLLPSARASVTVILKAGQDFAGSVDLDAQGLGGDLSVQFEPTRVDVPKGGSVQALLTVQASDTAAAAQRVLVVRGHSGEGLETADLVLDIPRATVFPVTTFLDGAQANVSFLAYQDGDGPWISVEGQGGAYKLPITDPNGRFGLIYGAICRIGDFTSWDVNGFFETTQDTSALYVAFYCNPQPGPPPLTFNLGGALRNTGGQFGLISANSGLWSFDEGASRYDMRLYKGLGDLVAATYGNRQDYIPSRIIVERGRDTQSSGTRDLDFASDGTDPLPRQTVQQPLLEAGESFRGTVQYRTSGGQTVFLGDGADLSQYAPFPLSAAHPGDAYVYGFQASTELASRTVVGSSTTSPGALTPRLPSVFRPFTVTPFGTSRLRLGLAWSPISPLPESHQATFYQREGLEEAYWYTAFSRRWLGDRAQFTWTPPDLALMPGFAPQFLFRPGLPTQVRMDQSGSQTIPDQIPPSLFATVMKQLGRPAGMPSRSPEPGPSVRPTAFRVHRIPGSQAAPPQESFYASRAMSLTP